MWVLFGKGGEGGLKMPGSGRQPLEIPLNPPLKKGEVKGIVGRIGLFWTLPKVNANHKCTVGGAHPARLKGGSWL